MDSFCFYQSLNYCFSLECANNKQLTFEHTYHSFKFNSIFMALEEHMYSKRLDLNGDSVLTPSDFTEAERYLLYLSYFYVLRFVLSF